MQDIYIGDIGDFGKYGLLRQFSDYPLHLAVNWYKVHPAAQTKQNDGKYTNYLLKPELYRHYDAALFDTLKSIVYEKPMRKIESIENAALFDATFFSEEIPSDRNTWHQLALEKTKHADIVFLDPDNGLETEKMHLEGHATEKHVKWHELKAYYDRGQSVILYQHRPQMTKKETCIKNIFDFNKQYLKADSLYALEFPKFTNRFYFFFAQQKHCADINEICTFMHLHWSGFCNQVAL